MESPEFDVLIAKAQALFDIGRYSDAFEPLAAAARMSPNNYRALCMLSYANFMIGDYQVAVDTANLAVIANPEGEWGHRLCSFALRVLGNAQEATRAALESVRLNPESYLAHFALAKAQMAAGDTWLAFKSAHKVVELEPATSTGHALLAEFALGQNDWHNAEEFATRALAVNPEDTKVLAVLAKAVQNSRGKRAALPLYVRLLQADPTNSTVQEVVLDSFTKLPHYVTPVLMCLSWVVLYRTHMLHAKPFWIATLSALALSPIMFRLWPQSMLYPQPAFWMLPAGHRAFVARTWRDQWLVRGSLVILTTTIWTVFIIVAGFLMIVILAIGIVAPPLGFALTGLISAAADKLGKPKPKGDKRRA